MAVTCIGTKLVSAKTNQFNYDQFNQFNYDLGLPLIPFAFNLEAWHFKENLYTRLEQFNAIKIRQLWGYFAKSLSTPFLQNTSGRLLLFIQKQLFTDVLQNRCF